MAKQNKSIEGKTNPFIWFLFAIVVPLIVAVIITVIILLVAGVNVGDWVKKTGSKIPVVSTVIKTDEEKNLEKQNAEATQTINKQNEEIAQLTDEIESLQTINEELEQEIVKLEKANENNTSKEPDEETETVNMVKQASTSFKDMDPEKAAPIFQSLEKSSAVSILKELSNDVRGEILAEMDPELAAELTELLMDQ